MLADSSRGLKIIEEQHPESVIVGVSTGNFLLNGNIHQAGLGVTAIDFGKGHFCSYSIDDTDDSFRDGALIGADIANEGKATGIVLFTSLDFPDPENFIESLSSKVDCPIIGGVASDHFTFDKSSVYLGHERQKMVMFVTFESAAVDLHTSTATGLDNRGCLYQVTKSNGSVIEEINHRPALDVYRDHLGDDFFKLPLAASNYPILSSTLSANQPAQSQPEETLIARCPQKYDFARKTITLGGSLPEAPSTIRILTYHDNETLLAAGVDAALGLTNSAPHQESLNLYFGCAMRHSQLGQLSQIEYDKALRNLRPGIPSFGFYGYGQYCPPTSKQPTVLHNLNVSIASFRHNTLYS